MPIKYRIKKQKHNNKINIIDGVTFRSKLEASYYKQLKLLKISGEVSFFLMQCPIHIIGGTKYVIDFIVFYSDGIVDFVDVKGMKTAMYKMKKKQVEEIYPFDITEITK